MSSLRAGERKIIQSISFVFVRHNSIIANQFAPTNKNKRFSEAAAVIAGSLDDAADCVFSRD